MNEWIKKMWRHGWTFWVLCYLKLKKRERKILYVLTCESKKAELLEKKSRMVFVGAGGEEVLGRCLPYMWKTAKTEIEDRMVFARG